MSATETLFEAIQTGDDMGVRKLLKADPELAAARNPAGVSALMTALYHRRRDLADILLRKTGAIDIFEAVSLGEREITAELLAEDPERANAWSGDGYSPIHLAAFFDHTPMVERLIRRGVDFQAASQNSMKVQPLHSAAAGASLGSVRALVAAGADVNAQQEGGWTALHSAAQRGDVNMARLLVEAGADLRAKADDGQMPIDVARAAGFDSVL